MSRKTKRYYLTHLLSNGTVEHEAVSGKPVEIPGYETHRFFACKADLDSGLRGYTRIVEVSTGVPVYTGKGSLAQIIEDARPYMDASLKYMNITLTELVGRTIARYGVAPAPEDL